MSAQHKKQDNYEVPALYILNYKIRPLEGPDPEIFRS